MALGIQVAHAKNPTFGFMDLPDRPAPKYPDDFIMVAIVEVPPGTEPDPDFAFQATNHIDGHWWDNESVTLVGEPTHRSTSVGDAVAMPDGRVLMCANTGWKELKS